MDEAIPIFALGDVASHSGPQMARAGLFQAMIVKKNILSMIRGERNLEKYKPKYFIEGAIKLVMGKNHSVIYARDVDGSDVMLPSKGERLDLDIGKGWRMLGAKYDPK